MKILLVISLMASLGFCKTGMTVAPHTVAPSTTSDWAKRNIIDFDEKGVYVKADYVRVYKAMLADHGSKLPVSNRPETPDTGITKLSADKYRITFEVRDRFDDLKFYERNGTP